ncbi:MAG: hypothetical protein BM564_01175 [Bacteroidetes bacterium MedPE-SWsnd-G2]|nr:MAG: hypothetical protein BM564_01175 [Bacteroidetes bacterium MedPE-SWsnd-G2]
MINFFRKIRLNLLSKNRFGKYLLYAFGEIVLVIIGILIALQINNYNEERKSQEQLTSTLLLVHAEIAQNIKDIDGMFLDFYQTDSIVNDIMHNRLNPDNYKKRERHIDPLNYWTSLDVRDHIFQKLILNTNNIPDKYKELISDLQKLYTYDKEFVQSSSNEMMEFVQDYAEWKKSNTNWYQYTYGRIKPELTDEEIAFYFTNNSTYKNFVCHYIYRSGMLLESVTTFRHEAYKIYKNLAKTLNLPPDEKDSFSIALTTEEIENILGTYRFENFAIEVKNKDDKLLFIEKVKDTTEYEKEMFFLSKSFFIIDNKYRRRFKTLNFDSNHKITSMTIKGGDYKVEGQKVK